MNQRRQLVKPGTYLVPVQNDTRHAKEDIGGGIGHSQRDAQKLSPHHEGR
jgi:hypothetical protein